MKFRTLNSDELLHFDDDLKHFLIINGVSNEEWTDLNTDNPEKAIELVGLFSDMIWQRVYEKIEYLEFQTPKQLFLFHCKKNEIDLIVLKSESKEVNFSTSELIHDSLINHAKKITYFQQSKKYNEDREIEIFNMVERGCIISSEEFYQKILKTIKE